MNLLYSTKTGVHYLANPHCRQPLTRLINPCSWDTVGINSKSLFPKILRCWWSSWYSIMWLLLLNPWQQESAKQYWMSDEQQHSRLILNIRKPWFNLQIDGELAPWRPTNPKQPCGNLVQYFITWCIRHALLQQWLWAHASVPVDRNLIRALCALIHILSQRLLPRLLLCAASLWMNVGHGWVWDPWVIKRSAVFGSGNNQGLVRYISVWWSTSFFRLMY